MRRNLRPTPDGEIHASLRRSPAPGNHTHMPTHLQSLVSTRTSWIGQHCFPDSIDSLGLDPAFWRGTGGSARSLTLAAHPFRPTPDTARIEWQPADS